MLIAYKGFLFLKYFSLLGWCVSLAVCESGVPDDLCDRHVPDRVSKSLSTRAAAALSLLCLLLSWPPSRHRGENSSLSINRPISPGPVAQ